MPLTKTQIERVFRKKQITLEDMETVASSPQLAKFHSIDLSNKNLTNEIVIALINSIHLGGLESLNLSNNNLTDKVVKLLLKPKFLPNLRNLNIRSNRVTSKVIPGLVSKYNKGLIPDEDEENITTTCGISIYFDIFKKVWVKLATGLDASMNFREILEFIKENTKPNEKEKSGSTGLSKDSLKIIAESSFNRGIGGAMGSSDSNSSLTLYAIEDFFYLLDDAGSDQLFEFEKEGLEEFNKRKKENTDTEDDDETPFYCECGAELSDEDLADWFPGSSKTVLCEACCREMGD